MTSPFCDITDLAELRALVQDGIREAAHEVVDAWNIKTEGSLWNKMDQAVEGLSEILGNRDPSREKKMCIKCNKEKLLIHFIQMEKEFSKLCTQCKIERLM